MHLYYSYSRLLQVAWGSQHLITIFRAAAAPPLLLLLPQRMHLQLEILLHPAAWWGEDASLLVAVCPERFAVMDYTSFRGTRS